MTGDQDDREQLGRAFVDLADTLVDGYDVVELLGRLVAHSVELLPVDAAGAVLVDGQRPPRVTASSNREAELMDLMQLHSEQGPGLDCCREGTQVSVPDLAGATHRWPRYVDAVAQRGAFRAVHALPLRLRGRTIGALTLFGVRPRALLPAERSLGQSLGDVATIGILQERAIRRAETHSDQLRTTVDGRLVIEQAKGVIRHHSNLTMDSAFDRLCRYALARNLRPSQVARDIVEGHLDPAALTSELMRNNRT